MLGLGVIAALCVLSFRLWVTDVEPSVTESSQIARPSAPTRPDGSEPLQTGETAREPTQPDSVAVLDATPTAFAESEQGRNGIEQSNPSVPASNDDGSGDRSPGTQPSSADVERPLAWCFYTTLDHAAVSDSNEVWSGSRSVVIREVGPVAESALRVNALWQAVDGALYRNARVQLIVHVKGGGGLFLFLHGVTNEELSLLNGPLGIASSNNRYVPSIAATGWTELSIVGDIRSDADVVFFGIAQNGRASLWVDDVRVTKVGVSSPVTSTPSQNAPLFLPVKPGATVPEPTNLDFEITMDGAPADAASAGGC